MTLYHAKAIIARTAIPPTTEPAMIPLVLVVVPLGSEDGVGVGITETAESDEDLSQLNDNQRGIPT